MKLASRMSGEQRRTAIIAAAQRVFVEKGFHGTTTRQLAEAAGVSEALLFKHFPGKEALYRAIQMSCFKEEGSRVHEWVQSLEPSTSALVFLVHDLVSHVLGGQTEEGERSFLRLVLRSLMDEGEFARLAIRGGQPTGSARSRSASRRRRPPATCWRDAPRRVWEAGSPIN